MAEIKIERRIKVVLVSGLCLFKMFEQDKVMNVLVEQGMPVGAKMVGAFMDVYTQDFGMYVEHPSFPDIPEGQTFPVMFIQLKDLSV